MSDHLIDEIANDLNDQQKRRELGLPPREPCRQCANRHWFGQMCEEIFLILAAASFPTGIIFAISKITN